MYDIRHLRYFVAVAAERSFTRAAERLNMAQPPLSRRIQDIEEELGARLFDRDARPLALTPAGRLFYEQAVQVIQRAEQMDASMRRFIASERPRFVMATVPSMLYARLPYVVRRFREQARDVDLSLVEMNSAEQIAALREGRIDVGFGRLRFDDPGLRREVLREEGFVVAMAPDHALALDGSPVGLEALRKVPIVVYPKEPRPSYCDLVISMFQDAGMYPCELIEVRELQTALVMAAAGQGVCVVPESIRRMGRVDLAFRDLAGDRRIPVIMRHRMDDRSDELRTLLRVLGDVYDGWDSPATHA